MLIFFADDARHRIVIVQRILLVLLFNPNEPGAWHNVPQKFSLKPHFTNNRRSGWRTNNIIPRLAGC